MNQSLMMNEVVPWVLQNARELEKKRLLYLLGKASKEEVIQALKAYQNPDGGFGHGLEPDCQNVMSSPIQTWASFDVIDELGLDPTHSFIESIVAYLLNTPDQENDFYFTLIPSNNLYPHAPWWTYQEQAKIWGYNPTIAIAGFLYTYGKSNPQAYDKAVRIIQKGMDDFITQDIVEVHELNAFFTMHERIKQDETHFPKLKPFQEKLLCQLDKTIEKDASLWYSSYSPRPLTFYKHKHMFGYLHFKSIIEKECQLVMEKRNDFGVWDITWTWGIYPEAFEKAKQSWMGILCVDYFKIMNQII